MFAVGLAQSQYGVTCLVCGKVLSNMSNAYRHYNLAHEVNQPAKCTICKKDFKNKLSRDDHYRKAHNLTPSAVKNSVQPRYTQYWFC